MLVTDKTWSNIRDKFSESEKQELRDAVIGEIICPRGFTIDIKKINVVLEFKLQQAIIEARERIQ